MGKLFDKCIEKAYEELDKRSPDLTDLGIRIRPRHLLSYFVAEKVIDKLTELLLTEKIEELNGRRTEILTQVANGKYSRLEDVLTDVLKILIDDDKLFKNTVFVYKKELVKSFLYFYFNIDVIDFISTDGLIETKLNQKKVLVQLDVIQKFNYKEHMEIVFIQGQPYVLFERKSRC